MEANAFETSMLKKRKQKRLRTIVFAVIAVIVLALGVVLAPRLLAVNEAVPAGVRTYQVGQVLEGEISTSISGSGFLTAKQIEAYAAPADAVVEAVFVLPGQRVSAGDPLVTLASEAAADELDALYDELDALRTTMARSAQIRSSRYVTAPRAGVVKDLQVASGDNMEDLDFLCNISTDGRMKLVIAPAAAVRQYDDVDVVIGADTVGGYVSAVSDGAVTIIIKDNSYLTGTAAAVYTGDGVPIGSGALELNEYITMWPEYGRILTVRVWEGMRVGKGENMFYMDYDAPHATYMENQAAEAELLERIAEKEASLFITAPFDALVTTVSAAAGEEVLAGAPLVTVLGLSGYTMSVSVDELDIYDIAIGQDASIAFDSVAGAYTGSVSNISYEGTTGGNVTTFPVTVSLDYQPGTFPGSTATARIITATSGVTLLVPVDAVQYEGGNAFLYLAPADAQLGASYAEAELDLTQLGKASVTTGMSDGSYVAVSGGVAAGSAIVVPKLTTTSTYSAVAAGNTTSTFTMGGMDMPPDGGGQRPAGMGGQRPGS